MNKNDQGSPIGNQKLQAISMCDRRIIWTAPPPILTAPHCPSEKQEETSENSPDRSGGVVPGLAPFG